METPLPQSSETIKEKAKPARRFFFGKISFRELLLSSGIIVAVVCLLLTLSFALNGGKIESIISPLITSLLPSKSLNDVQPGHEVFGFAPYWMLQKLDTVDFSTLTTLAYFGIPITKEGNLDTDDLGYKRLSSERATELFTKAHEHGTRVVLTLTIMDNDTIKAFLDDPVAQKRAIAQATHEVSSRGLDGLNIDIEYVGNPGPTYKDKFSHFVSETTSSLHASLPDSYVTVSVYASSVKLPKLYDIASLGKSADGVFMMAYDFATSGSDTVIPTSPLYGYKEGRYWYDVSTAVEDFLTVMPPEKLILGLPWYGYNYPVEQPEIKAAKYEGYSYYYWQNRRRYLAEFLPTANAQSYTSAANDIVAEKTGWDEIGKVGWKAYQEDGIWRMLFLDDQKSLQLKYQFAKEKKLAGIGIWALGFENGQDELWAVIRQEFGNKLADTRVKPN